MSTELITILISLFAAVISIVSLVIATIIAIKSWHRNRVVYDLEEFSLRRLNGSRNDAEDRGLSAITDRLKTGKYVIESFEQRKDGDWAVFLSKVKK